MENLKQKALIGVATTSLALSLFATAAFATQPHEFKGTNSQGNCNGVRSSASYRNGTDVREEAKAGTRADNVHGYQAESDAACAQPANMPPGQQ